MIRTHFHEVFLCHRRSYGYIEWGEKKIPYLISLYIFSRFIKLALMGVCLSKRGCSMSQFELNEALHSKIKSPYAKFIYHEKTSYHIEAKAVFLCCSDCAA